MCYNSRMKLLLIEDDQQDAKFIRSGLSDAGYLCDIAPTGERGLELLRLGTYDLAIVDFMLPGISGLQVIRTARQERIRTPLFILSAMDDTDVKVAGLNHGAEDYLTKPFAMDELIARVNVQLRRHAGSGNESPLVFEDLRLDPVNHTVFRNRRKLDLTGIEYRLIECFLRNPGRIFSARTIMERIWDYRASMSSNLVEVRIHGLRKKLNAEGERDLIANVRGLGYVLR